MRSEKINLLSLAEVAAQTGLHPASIRKRLTEGRSDAIRVAGVWLFTKSQAAQLAAESRPGKKRAKKERDQ